MPILSSGREEIREHRSDFEECPHCGHKMGFDKWCKLAHTLSLKPKFANSGSAGVSSECPKCFGMSWVHVSFSRVAGGEFPPEWKAVVKESTP